MIRIDLMIGWNLFQKTVQIGSVRIEVSVGNDDLTFIKIMIFLTW